jgi:hypothetical protein
MFTAGAIVKGGFYFNRDKLDLVAVSGKQGTLPGAEGQRYFRISALAVIALAPVLGGLFVVFMPFIGFALVLQHLGRLTVAGAKRAGRRLLFIVTPTWRPGEAYFAGKEGEKQAAADAKASQAAPDESPSQGPGAPEQK